MFLKKAFAFTLLFLLSLNSLEGSNNSSTKKIAHHEPFKTDTVSNLEEKEADTYTGYRYLTSDVPQEDDDQLRTNYQHTYERITDIKYD